MKDYHRLTVQIEFFYNPDKFLQDPRDLDEFKSAIFSMKNIFSCNNILFYDEVYSRDILDEEFYKEINHDR